MILEWENDVILDFDTFDCFVSSQNNKPIVSIGFPPYEEDF